MKINWKSVYAITRINFKRSTWIAYLVAGLCFLNSFVQSIVYYLINVSDNTSISEGNMLLLALILAAILIPAVNFKKIMHLNGKKTDFLVGSLLNYIVFSAVIAALNLFLLYTFDKAVSPVLTLWNISDIFGWLNDGIAMAFLRQFAFYLLLGVSLHTLTAMQTFWWGWVVDLVIAAIISVFTPIEPLRKMLLDFFNTIIFNGNAIEHIVVCLALSAAIYALNIPILSRKKI